MQVIHKLFSSQAGISLASIPVRNKNRMTGSPALLMLVLWAVQKSSAQGTGTAGGGGGGGHGCSLAPDCGNPAVQPASHRVVGGQEALRGSWPWTALLTELNFAACAGAIISDRVILTAAHCFEEFISRNASRWTVHAGKHNLFRTETGEMSFSVEKIIVHDGYVYETVANDIALMILRDRIPFTNFIRPLCIPEGSALAPGTPCLLAGWGDTKGTSPRGVLTEVRLPVISDQLCGHRGWYGRSFIPQMTFCAGYEDGGVDACRGDSGGPLIFYSEGRWFAAGIASWGHGCAEPRWPGVYTNVSHFLPWLHDRLTDNGLPGLCSNDPLVG